MFCYFGRPQIPESLFACLLGQRRASQGGRSVPPRLHNGNHGDLRNSPDISWRMDANLVYRAITGHVGASNPVTRRNLSLLTGLSDRAVRAAIHELVVQKHLPICSSTGGYFLAATQDEIAAQVRYLTSYAGELFERAHALERAAARFEPQQLTVLGD